MSDENKTQRKRWTKEETILFIDCYKSRLRELSHPRRRMEAFSSILEDMKRKGFNTTGVSPNSLRLKIKSLKTSYEATKDNAKRAGAGTYYCPFYDEIDDIFGHKATSSMKSKLNKGKLDSARSLTPPSDEMLELLKSWKLECVYRVLKDNKINIGNLAFLQERDIETLIPLLRTRAAFKLNWSAWKKNLVHHRAFESDSETEAPSTSSAAPKRNYEIAFESDSCTGEAELYAEPPNTIIKTELDLESEKEFDPMESENVTDCHIEQATHQKQYLDERFGRQSRLSLDGQSVDESFKELGGMTSLPHDDADDDGLYELLMKWEVPQLYGLLNSQKINKRVLKIMKPKHMDQILKEMLVGEQALFEHYFESWQTTFQVESSSTPQPDRELKENVPNNNARPNLLDDICEEKPSCMQTENNLNKERETANSQDTAEILQTPAINYISEENAESIVNAMRSTSQSSEKFVDLWQQCHCHRFKQIAESKSLVETFTKWPEYENNLKFINLDFPLKFVNSQNFKSLWLRKRICLLRIMKKRISHTTVLNVLNDVSGANTNDEATTTDLAMLWSLHALLAPIVCRANLQNGSEADRKMQSYSVGDSQNAFVLMGSSLTEISNKFNMKTSFPRLVVVGDMQNITQVYVYFYGNYHKMNSVLDAFDQALKIHSTLNIPYPPEAEAFYTFIQNYFCKMPTAVQSTKILALMSELDEEDA